MTLDPKQIAEIVRAISAAVDEELAPIRKRLDRLEEQERWIDRFRADEEAFEELHGI